VLFVELNTDCLLIPSLPVPRPFRSFFATESSKNPQFVEMEACCCEWEACGKAFYVRQFQPDDCSRVKELFAQGLEEHVPALPVELQDEVIAAQVKRG